MESKTITIRMKNAYIEQLRVLAREMSFKQNKDITYVDLIRTAIYKEYGIGNKNGQ